MSIARGQRKVTDTVYTVTDTEAPRISAQYICAEEIMRKRRAFIPGVFYHVTSRTNDKIRAFDSNLGRKIMLLTLQAAKDKFRFTLADFCVMPTHIHLLIKPEEGTGLSVIMQWIKTNSAKRWNRVHGSIDHLWGERYFARPVKTPEEYDYVTNYIEQNPVASGLAESPQDWKASGAYHRARKISGLVSDTFSKYWSDYYIKNPQKPQNGD